MRSLQIDISSNIASETRWLRKAQRKQVPYAAALTINSLAFECQKATRKQAGVSFDLKKQLVPRGIRVNRANKKNLSAWIGFINKDGSYDERHWYMRTQTFGGTRTPKKAKHIAIPIKSNIKRKQTKGYKNLIVLGKGSKKGLYRKYKRKAPKKFFGLVRSQKVAKNYPFFIVCRDTIKRKFKSEWRKALTKALSTAK